MGTSLWIVPDEQDAERLQKIMRRTRQSERPNFPSSYPAFHPHVTLASFPSPSPSAPPSIADIRAALHALPHPSPRPIEIHFQSLKTGTHFFRSVYIAAAPTPALRALHEAVHARLGIAPRTPEFPHVSLCYVDEGDAEERGRFWGEVVQAGVRCERERGEGEGGSVSLRCEEGGWIGGFEAREVWVVECDGPVEGWTVLDKISIV